MKLFIKLRNKYFTAFVSLVLLVLSSIGLFNLYSAPKSVDASMIKFDNEKTITITNGSFTSFSSSTSYPYTLSNYTNSGIETPSLKAGAINISDSAYKKYYKDYGFTQEYGLSEYDNPKAEGTKDNYILMINSKETTDYTYMSKEFTLPANGHYYITVSAKTLGSNSLASVFLMQGETVFRDCAIQNITSSEWSNYTFFVTTNTYESVTLKFGMQIGSLSTGASGCVLFDELHAGQIAYSTLENCLEVFDNNTYKHVELRSPNAYKTYNFNNQITSYTHNNGELVSTTVNDNYFATSSSGGGEKHVDFNNNTINITAQDTHVSFKGQTEMLEPNSTYRFAMYVKANEITNGSAFIKLDEIVEDESEYEDFMNSSTSEITPKSSNLTITSTTSSAITNGYEEYVVYVNTGALKQSKVEFSFGLGAESATATGSVSFKDFVIERVPYSAYSAASSGSKIGKINIADRISLNSSEYANYTFDKMQSNSFDGVQYPATPSDWTVNTDNVGNQLSGVVNLSAFDKMMDKYSSKLSQMATPASLTSNLNNNVLMIYNGNSAVQSYTSSSKSLTANKFYKITAFVYTQIWDQDASGVTVVAKSGDAVLAKASGVKTEGKWQRVVLYINTPSNSVDVSLELSLGYGNNKSSGYAFFDNIFVEESSTANEFSSRFDAFTVANNGEVSVDLNDLMLSHTSSKEYNAPILYTGNNIGRTTVNAGIVDLTRPNLSVVSNMEEFQKLAGDSDKVLGISTALEMDAHYEYTSLIGYKFESGKYYKLSFDLFTDGIGQEDKENKYDGSKLAQGANIELTGLENAKFSYITSNNAWTTYEYYIGVDESTTSKFVFSMGTEFGGCYGRAFVGNINLEEVDKAQFTSATAGDKVLKVDTIAVEKDEDKDEETSTGNNFSWVYIPTIATFLAIVAAVVGVFVRRNVKFKKRVGNKKAVYDRDTTVMQHKYRRLASDKRDKEVRELTKECNELIELRNGYEEKYKEALSRLRSARLANRDGSKRHEIMAIEREVKHISKEVARYGVQVNNYENEIEFMQTEAYLIDLEKRMMREDTTMRTRLRKEAELPEEKRLEAIAKRENKQAIKQEKNEYKAQKLADKQAKLEQERKSVEMQLAQAKALDEQYVKEQELKRIKAEEERVAKEKAKAEKELRKLEEEKARQEAEKQKLEQELEQAKEQAVEETAKEEIAPVDEQSTEIKDNAEESVDNAEVVETENVEQTPEQPEAPAEEPATPVEPDQPAAADVNADVESAEQATADSTEDNLQSNSTEDNQ